MLPDPSTGYGEACWPLGGEIDIAGAHGGGRGGPGSSPNAVESGYHFAPGGVCGARSEARGRHRVVKNLNLDGEFHAYAVEWDKSSLRFYVDGVLTNVLDRLTVPIVPRWPFYLILNTEMSPFGMPDATTNATRLFHHVAAEGLQRPRWPCTRTWQVLSLATIGALDAVVRGLRRAAKEPGRRRRVGTRERNGFGPGLTSTRPSATSTTTRRTTTRPSAAREADDRAKEGRSRAGVNVTGSRYDRDRPSGSDLRLLDAGLTRERRLEGEASVDRRRRSSRRSAEERAPLVGGVGLRVPTDSTPSHSSHGSDGGEYGGNGGGLRWRRAGSTSVFGSRPAFGPPLRAFEGSVGSGSSGAGSDDDAASFAPAAVRVSA